MMPALFELCYCTALPSAKIAYFGDIWMKYESVDVIHLVASVYNRRVHIQHNTSFQKIQN